MKSKFQIGEEVFYMNFTTPSKGLIKGIVFTYGSIEESGFNKKSDSNDPVITYSFGPYVSVDEDKVFATKQEFQDSLFSKL